ncbi:hypothetical protein ScPMuIL_017131 [Solemya velum]
MVQKKKDKGAMARKKQEIQLQQEIETQDEWEEMLGKEGLFVVDVYQQWCGPCMGMASNFKRVKNEIGDDLLRFAVAKSDTIDALEKYRGRCEPCFLFYAGGLLVQVIRGANSPLVLRTITEQLAYEHKVLEGQAERKEVKDQFLTAQDQVEEPEEPQQEEEEEEAKVEVTVAIIKPDAVQAGKVDEIISEMKEKGIEILRDEERQLKEEEAREFYSHVKEEEFFEDLVKFMCSGPCHVLVLTKAKTGENIIEEWRSMLGPTSVEEARESAPESWRAKYGSGNFMNALHGSNSPDMAARELAFFFPNFAVPSKVAQAKLQRTLALIRPDAFKLHKDEILDKIRESGFQVAMQKEMFLTKEQAEAFYSEHMGQPYFEELVNRMISGPLMALGLARQDAVTGWREMLGPTEVNKAKEEDPNSLRAQYALEDTEINMLHGSDSEETAKRELEFFFPMEQTVAMIKPDAYGTKDDIIDKVHQAGFRIAARKETTLSRDVAEEFYSEHKDKDYYNDLVEQMCSGPTYFMVLSREDAVDGWRSLIGPTDPEKAREEKPESLRASFGNTILQNAVHGSSSREQAEMSMKVIFGDLHFKPDGTLQGEELLGKKPEEEDKDATTEPAQAESKPDEAKQKPAEEQGEQKPAEEQSEQKPTEEQAEQKPAEESEQKPAEEQAEQKPDSEQKPAEQAEQKPAAETEQKDDSEEKPEPEAEQKPEAEAEQKPEAEAEQKPEAEQQEDQKPEGDTSAPAEQEEQKAEEAAETPAEPNPDKPKEE